MCIQSSWERAAERFMTAMAMRCCQQRLAPTRAFGRPASNPRHFTHQFSQTTKHLSSKPAVDFNTLKETLLARLLPTLTEPLVYTPSHKLTSTLQTFLPPFVLPNHSLLQDPSTAQTVLLPPAWHLIHFNSALPADRLLPDGTDPAQSPGPPFIRRMWAGGALNFNQELAQPALDGRLYEMRESIGSVDVKGTEGNEKVFVGIDRRLYGPGDTEYLHERRNIVFLQEQPDSAKAAGAPPRAKGTFGKKAEKEAPETSTGKEELYHHTLIPTPSLLFRYSALTFNAHAIHLDPSYCREIEGHRNLLVHGPLSLTLLTTFLNGIIRQHYAPPDESMGEVKTHPGLEAWFVSRVEYRNVAPLYTEEPMTLFVKRIPTPGAQQSAGEAATTDIGREDKTYKMWIEGPTGTISVRAVATVSARPDQKNPGRDSVTEAVGTGLLFGAFASVFD